MFVLFNMDFKLSLVVLIFGWFNLIFYCLFVNLFNKLLNIFLYNLFMLLLILGIIGILV